MGRTGVGVTLFVALRASLLGWLYGIGAVVGRFVTGVSIGACRGYVSIAMVVGAPPCSIFLRTNGAFLSHFCTQHTFFCACRTRQ